ncbi:MAG: hypothetical protein GY774_34585 [Planctomycetes bacterium]|nr:hypothetical protein [Planctomycetota bacterium]
MEFSGSETFVQKQIDEFKELIYSNLKAVKAKKQNGKLSEKQPDQVDESATDTSDNPYPNVFEYDGEEINILKVPGKDNATKTKYLTLIYLYAKEKFGRKAISTKEIHKQCESHGCLDSPNFSSILGRIKKEYVILKGKGKVKTIKLTKPGRENAKELIESLNAEN